MDPAVHDKKKKKKKKKRSKEEVRNVAIETFAAFFVLSHVDILVHLPKKIHGQTRENGLQTFAVIS